MTAAPSIPAWRHQAAGREFARQLWGQGQRATMLAMFMGTGKTRLAIDLINDLEAPFPLIICPIRVVEPWRLQFEKYSAAHYEFAALDDRFSSVRDKWAHARDMRAWALARNQKLAIAINYESARTEPFASWALKVPWPVVVADEIHRVKDGNGRTSRWLAKLGRCARYRLGLTGTPMPHSPLDIWGQFRFLDPSILDPTFGSFKLRHAVMGGYKNKEIVGWRDLDQLYADFRKIAYQVDESALELPDAIDEVLETDFTGDGRRVYAEMENEMVAWIRDMDGKGVEVTAANAMVRLTRLQQITGGSLPDEQGRPAIVDGGKEELLSDFLADIGKEPVVVFAVYRADLAAIRRAAEANGLKWAEVSGRRDELARWQGQVTGFGLAPIKREGERFAEDDEPPTVLAVQIQSGGEGIDLTRARICVYYSHGFSLAHYKQSRSRIWRPPQTRPCAFYHLQIRHSIDQYVLRAVLARQDLVESVLKGLRRS